MKSGLMIGLCVGMIAATTIYQSCQTKSFAQKTKKAIVKKIEDIIN